MILTKDSFELLYITEPNTGCYLWLGGVDKGRGYIWHNRHKKETAPRVVYRLFKGNFPNNLMIRHTCDNPLCVNPTHLLVGTAQDNRNDCVRRNRQAKGSTHVGSRKLTPDQVKYIRESNERTTDLAKMFGVHQSTVSKARTGAQWRNLPLY